LKNIISQTIFAVSDNDAKLVHTGSLFKIVDNSLTVVSVDGYRLAMRKETLSEKFDSEFSFIVPGKTLSEIERICGETDDNVILSIGRKHMLFKTGNTTLVTRLLDGDFINYDAAIPKNSKVKVSASRRELLESIERVSLLISEQLKNPIRCNFCDGVLKLSCATALGKAHDAVMIEGDGDNIEIGFNHRYFLDALKNAPTDKVYIEINSNLSPCIITPPEGDSFLYMVLPVRLRSSSEDN